MQQASTAVIASQLTLAIQADLQASSQSTMNALVGMGMSVSQAQSAAAIITASLSLNIAAIMEQAGLTGGVLGEILRAISVSLNAKYARPVSMNPTYSSQGLTNYRAERI